MRAAPRDILLLCSFIPAGEKTAVRGDKRVYSAIDILSQKTTVSLRAVAEGLFVTGCKAVPARSIWAVLLFE